MSTSTLHPRTDSYTDSEGKDHKSCFKLHNGLYIIADQEEWSKRCGKFRDRVLHHLTTIPSKEMTLEQLFYDGYNGGSRTVPNQGPTNDKDVSMERPMNDPSAHEDPLDLEPTSRERFGNGRNGPALGHRCRLLHRPLDVPQMERPTKRKEGPAKENKDRKRLIHPADKMGAVGVRALRTCVQVVRVGVQLEVHAVD
ncbi:hypothetical protein BC832DRAFT_590954 [Gaertneriomyces semiglobifer]|nr:hypothetical protein BC832DRAFT_590954 [Gaertneriomyces semiglobifer]